MFDLEQSIADWRRQMLAAGIKAPVPLDELETHLREEFEQKVNSGLDEQKAFEISIQQIGKPQHLIMEFKKIDAENWNRPFVWTAWVMFTISFFLPAFDTGGGWLWGWQCAWVSLGAWGGTGLDNSVNIHLALLTLANLLMIISPFLLPRLSRNPHSRMWLRFFCWSALLLVWSFIIRSFVADGWKDLKIGCYVWAVSFLSLALATVAARTRNAVALANL